MSKEDVAKTILECHGDMGVRIKDLVLWMKVLNCIVPVFDVEEKYPVDAGLPVTEASFQDCIGKFMEIAHKLTSDWNTITQAFINEKCNVKE